MRLVVSTILSVALCENVMVLQAIRQAEVDAQAARQAEEDARIARQAEEEAQAVLRAAEEARAARQAEEEALWLPFRLKKKQGPLSKLQQRQRYF